MKVSNAVVVGLVCAFTSGCAYLPKGYSSRAIQTPTEDLFVGDDAPVTSSSVSVGAQATDTAGARVAGTQATPQGKSGLRIRKSDRGNMESYVVRGQRYYTLGESDGYSARGVASWYGPNFHGRTASNGEVYDMYRLTAAHKTLPLPTYARVTHLDNNRSVIVKINDRGPFSGDRIVDLSFAAALRLGMVNDGTAMVEIQAMSPEEMMALSGPENKLGIDFYQVGEESEERPSASAVQVAAQQAPDGGLPIAPSLPLEGAAPTDDIKVAAVKVDDSPITAQPILNDTPIQNDIVVAPTDIAATNDAGRIESVESGGSSAADPVSADSLLEDLFTSSKPKPQQLVEEGSDDLIVTVAASAAQSAANTVVNPVVNNESVVTTGPLASESIDIADVLVPVSDAAQGVSSVSAAVPGAMQAVRLPSDKQRSGFYIQAGVYADVTIAERVAVDVVLASPGEEVHVKPLKNSHMYRITVGPIVSAEHASKVSNQLDEAGVENFTVIVK